MYNQRIISELKRSLLLVKRYSVSFIDKINIFMDYMNLYHNKGLIIDEYYDFEFEKQSDEFRQTFLGQNEQRYYLDYLNPIKYYSLARNKYLTHKILENTGVRKAKLYCYYQPEGKVIESNEIANSLVNVCCILKAKNVTECVVKPTESSHGNNVYIVTHLEYETDDCKLILFNNEVIKLSDILGRNSMIFESVIKQTAQFASFNESSVNTIRFMTVLYPNGKARMAGIWMKFGRSGRCVDNAGSGGNIDACVDITTGEIKYVTEFNGWRNTKVITHHPDSGTLLEGVKIDDWDNIAAQVLHFQESFPYIKAAGWDIAITDKGPVVIEVNDFWDRTGQYFIRRGWRNEIRDCYLAWRSYWDMGIVSERQIHESNNLLTSEGKEYNLCRQPNSLSIDHLRKIVVHEYE